MIEQGRICIHLDEMVMEIESVRNRLAELAILLKEKDLTWSDDRIRYELGERLGSLQSLALDATWIMRLSLIDFVPEDDQNEEAHRPHEP